MESYEDEAKRGDDETRRHVKLAEGFWLAETETTQELWEAVMKGDNPSAFNGYAGSYYDKKLWRPVENVSWYDCQEFIALLNTNKLGLKFSLPSEEEW